MTSLEQTRRQKKRANYKRNRRKKFLYLKHTGKLENYNKQREQKPSVKVAELPTKDWLYAKPENMNLLKLLKSRTFWSLVALFVINGVGGIRDSIPSGVLPVVDGILGILVIYFAKVSPRVKL